MEFACSYNDTSTSYDDNEIEDEFLFQSIHRYNTLQMFDLENVPCHLLQIDNLTLCLGSKRYKGENSEILSLKLPEKLTLPPEDKGRSKENDFKVLSSIHTKNVVYQIDKIASSNIITSERNTKGLVVYPFPLTASGQKDQRDILDIAPWTQPDFALLPESTSIICSKSCHLPLIQGDILSGNVIKEIEHPFLSLKVNPEDSSGKIDPSHVNNIKCKAITSDLIAMLNIYSGEVLLHDLRTKDSFVSLPITSIKNSKEIWTISGWDYKESSFDLFGILSNKTSFCIYDKRNNSKLFEKSGERELREHCNKMKLKFNNKNDQFSISGVNPNVDVFKINEKGFEHVFTHIGHCPSGSPFVVSTDHIWLQTGGNEYIVSICDNGTLNCWDYKEKFLLDNDIRNI